MSSETCREPIWSVRQGVRHSSNVKGRVNCQPLCQSSDCCYQSTWIYVYASYANVQFYRAMYRERERQVRECNQVIKTSWGCYSIPHACQCITTTIYPLQASWAVCITSQAIRRKGEKASWCPRIRASNDNARLWENG